MNNNLTLKTIIADLKSKKYSVAELNKSVTDKIEKSDVGAFLSYAAPDQQTVKLSQERYDNNTPLPLDGVPVGIKDNIAVKDMKLTCGSKILENFVSPYDATVVTRLKNAGVIIAGKNNMDEFAMGSTTENSAFYPTKNPVNKDYVPGGSSGGSAAAVAAGLVPLSLGSDTGGSVRQPAGFCGIVGYKPSYGLLSRYGLTAFGSSLDQIGTLTNSCEDAAFVTGLMMGADTRDSTSSTTEPDNIKNFKPIDIKGKKFGVITESMNHADQAVKDRINHTLAGMEKLGAIIDYVSIKELEYAVSIYYIIAPAEASSNLSRYDGIRFGLQPDKSKPHDAKTIYSDVRSKGFGEEVKRRILIGNFVLSSGYYDAYYKKAQKARIVISDKLNEAFKKFDYLITPTSPVLPFKLGQTIDDPLKLYTSDICTIPVNLAGLPGVSIPAGVSNGLPVGLQVIGRRFDDGRLLGTCEYIMRSI